MDTPSAASASVSRQIRHYARARAWCEWSDFHRWSERVQADMADPAGAAWPPFLLLAMPGIDAATQRVCATRWLATRLAALHATPAAEAMPRLPPTGPPAGPGRTRLRVGYLSGDFQEHATAMLMVEMLEAHNRDLVELYAYSHAQDDGKGMRQRLMPLFDGFRDIQALDDRQAAQQVRDDAIDILVDLKGYTQGSRTLLLAHRPAAIQVSFLGYPGTLGQNFIDYLISDRFVTPHAAAGDYQEALACMPHSYQPRGRVREAPQPPPTRRASGLPEQAFVFACFNQAWKLTPEVFDVWCELLRSVPDSVLWLLEDAQAGGNLRNEALARGVSPHRLVFAPDLPQAAHLARLPLMDLMLDTWPYNAHTTASDALSAGVPLVTLAGQTFASRVAGGLLAAAGLPELITYSPLDYVALARALALDPRRLQVLRQDYERQRHTAHLFDVPAYTAALEALYARMWARHRAGLPPSAIDLPAPRARGPAPDPAKKADA